MNSANPATPNVPNLADPTRWRTTADGKVIVTPDNFIRAESDVYMAGQFKDGAFGKFKVGGENANVGHFGPPGLLVMPCSGSPAPAPRPPGRLARPRHSP